MMQAPVMNTMSNAGTRAQTLTVLNVAYPLAPVRSDAAGGAEQVLALLDEALVARGHRSLIVAAQGSQVAGELFPIPRMAGPFDDSTRRAACEYQRAAIQRALSAMHVDLVHMHGLDFYRYLPPPGVPVLVTLHLPPDWYPSEIFQLDRPKTFMHCVSASQQRNCAPCANLIGIIENGVAVERLANNYRKRNWALALGRICPEKGLHIALDAAKGAGVPLILAGQVYPYEAHERYYHQEIRPRLDECRIFVGPVDVARKRRLLAGARCLLVPSLVAETSSLVAMEALACGTPVIAYPSGALADIVEHGKTGFLVHNVEEMTDAIHAAHYLDPETCRRTARERFSAQRMISQYMDVYRNLAALDNSDGLDAD